MMHKVWCAVYDPLSGPCDCQEPRSRIETALRKAFALGVEFQQWSESGTQQGGQRAANKRRKLEELIKELR